MQIKTSDFNEILDFITTVRESFVGAEKVYSEGSCVQFGLILKEVFPLGKIYYNEDHAIFKYNNHFFDITGEVSGEGYVDIEEMGILKINRLLKLKYDISTSSKYRL